jgi:hypothetical protein
MLSYFSAIPIFDPDLRKADFLTQSILITAEFPQIIKKFLEYLCGAIRLKYDYNSNEKPYVYWTQR